MYCKNSIHGPLSLIVHFKTRATVGGMQMMHSTRELVESSKLFTKKDPVIHLRYGGAFPQLHKGPEIS